MKQFFIVLIILGILFPSKVFAAGVIDINDRSIFNYELLDVSINNDKLHLKGWGLLINVQNFYGSSTHDLTIELKSGNKYIEVPTTLTNRSLTSNIRYDGYSFCSDKTYYSTKCNYKYENVGFEASVDIAELNSDATYEFYLTIRTVQTNEQYRTPLYYAQDKKLETTLSGRQVILNSQFETMSFVVASDTLKVTSTPAHSSTGNQMRQGSSCSSSYGNLLFYKAGTRFDKPLGKALYDNLITYYKVKFSLDQCVNQRRRVVESSNGTVSYIPSTYINYRGKPLTISILSIPKPILSANDHIIEQYDEYHPLKYVTAHDKSEGDITDKVKLVKTTVNTRYPDVYESCYEVLNNQGQSDSKCVKATVVPVKTKLRYINQSSFPFADLQIWEIKDFRTFLLTLLGK